ncbi:hypothetical protein ABIB25_004040 [Nakamurella sp. UYEF19]|uniref:hypothetical protein n=1 Tax=Nakamurella sp. UYEF19 TaxID=1756392 RepID=UPI0033943018
MTTQETDRIDGAARSGSTKSTKSSDKAYERRMRRDRALADRRLTRTGSPISSALTRVPFVVLVILLLAGGVVGVLWLNTMSDAVGLRAGSSRLEQAALTAKIQAENRSVQALRDPSVLASEASALGMVPPGDAAILVVDPKGKGSVVGTPSAVPGPAAAAGASPTTAATTARVTTAPVSTAPATTAPVAPPKTTAPRTTPKVVVPPKVTPPKVTTRAAAPRTTRAKTAVPRTAPKTTAPRTTAPKTTAKTTAPKTTAPGTTAVRAASTATTGG